MPIIELLYTGKIETSIDDGSKFLGISYTGTGTKVISIKLKTHLLIASFSSNLAVKAKAAENKANIQMPHMKTKSSQKCESAVIEAVPPTVEVIDVLSSDDEGNSVVKPETENKDWAKVRMRNIEVIDVMSSDDYEEGNSVVKPELTENKDWTKEHIPQIKQEFAQKQGSSVISKDEPPIKRIRTVGDRKLEFGSN